jgi:histo-blood group ABO system transferase
LLASAKQFFCPGHDVQFFVFTDVPIEPDGQIRRWAVAHEPWPGPALHRYRTILMAADELLACDYVYYVDVDSRYVRPVGDEIFGDLVATIHCGFCDQPRSQFTYETRSGSRACIYPHEGRRYYASGFLGGRSEILVKAMRTMNAAIVDDESRGIIACWHDESHWNRYLIDHPPTVELSHDYNCPASWRPETQRMVIVDKNHQEVRSMNRILIGALSGWKYPDRRQRCQATWMADGKECGVESVFLLGCPTVPQPEMVGQHALACPCPDDYASLPQRTRSFCRWAIERDDWDYLFKCDDDTYVSIPRLIRYDMGGRDYVGAEWQPGAGYGSGGAGYFLSRKAATVIAQRLVQSCGNEDQLVGETLRVAGIGLSIEPRLVPFGSMDHRPKRDNDLITLHGVGAAAFLTAHAETGLHAPLNGTSLPSIVDLDSRRDFQDAAKPQEKRGSLALDEPLFNAVVFSRNRACQLELFLRSWQQFVAGNVSPSVLWLATTAEFECGYSKLMGSQGNNRFVRQENFRKDCLNLVKASNPYTVFFVDDMLFRREVRFDSSIVMPLQADDVLCVSLRLSPKITYCYSCNHPSPLPDYLKRNDWNVWRWRGASGDWGYPLSLDGHIFRTAELLPLMERLPWETPNQLECVMASNPLDRPLMACREDHAVTNIPANRVQGVFGNRFMNEGLSAEELNGRYLGGQTIDLAPLAAMETDSCHFEAKYQMAADSKQLIERVV